MTTFSNNGASRSQGDAFPRAAASARRPHVAADAAVTGDLSEAARRANAGARAARAPQASQGSPAAQAQQRPQPSRRRATRADKKKLAAASGRAGSPAAGSRAATRRTPRKASGLMRYANDNRFVQAANAVLTGPYRVAVYACVAVALGAGLYAPVRDLYVARRNNYILSQQLKIRQDYNDTLEKEVNSYLSTDGIEQAARGMGLVTEGEKTITVTGTDENGDPVDASSSSSDGSSDASGSQDSSSSSDSTDAKTSSDVERAEAAVFQNSPWYYKVLDSLFSYTGSEGQVVVAASGADAQ